MKRYLSTLTLALVCGAAPFTPVIAEEADAPFSVNLAAGFYSDYMFRGQNLYDGISIQPSIQPVYDMGEYGRLSGLHWMHLSAEGDRQEEKFFEMDESVSYDYELEPLTFTVSHLWYLYPRDSDGIDNTKEVYAAVTFDTLLSPSVSFAHDYDEFDYEYYELGFRHRFECAGESPWNVTPFVNFGFASNSEKVYADNGFVQSTFGLTSDLSVGDVGLAPLLAYTAGADDLTDDELWMGVALSYSF